MKQRYRRYTKEYTRELTLWQRIYSPEQVKFAMALRRIRNHAQKRRDVEEKRCRRLLQS